ncbi:MAG: DUF1080 domain-containing protein [Bacteroidota bacterium]
MGRPRNLFKNTSITVISLMIALFGVLISCKSSQKEEKSETGTTSESSVAVTSLFNGKDLSGWYTYLRPPEPGSVVEGMEKVDGKYVEPIGLHKDPLHVFTVVVEDDAPAIRISGEVFGVLTTDREFENYHLSLEFKWGEKRFPPREDSKRDSGVLYHSVGKEGVAGGSWKRSVELQVQEGDVGDLWCVDSTTAMVRTIRLPNKKYRYDRQGEYREIDMREDRYCQKSADFEKPNGAWNRLDIFAYGRESIHAVNGQKNMHLTNIGEFVDGRIMPLSKGRIQIQSEGAEVFYRNINIKSIKELPEVR